MIEENAQFRERPYTLRQIELEVQAAQAQAFRDMIAWVGSALRHVTRASVALAGRTGADAVAAYRERLSEMRGYSLPTSKL